MSSKFSDIHTDIPAQNGTKRKVKPEEIAGLDPEWLRVARRMMSVSKSRGVQLITMTVVVDADGSPKFWFTPKVQQVEPAASAAEFLKVILGMSDKGID